MIDEKTEGKLNFINDIAGAFVDKIIFIRDNIEMASPFLSVDLISELHRVTKIASKKFEREDNDICINCNKRTLVSLYSADGGIDHFCRNPACGSKVIYKSGNIDN